MAPQAPSSKMPRLGENSKGISVGGVGTPGIGLGTPGTPSTLGTSGGRVNSYRVIRCTAISIGLIGHRTCKSVVVVH